MRKLFIISLMALVLMVPINAMAAIIGPFDLAIQQKRIGHV